MRVALVLKTNQGGLWTLPQIRELQERAHEVTVVLPAGDGRLRAALETQRATVVESAFSFRFHPGPRTISELLRLRDQLRAIAPDVVFYHLYASALAARLTTIGLGIPRVHMVAGPLYLESPAIRMVERWLVKLDWVTIGGSEFTANLYRQLGRSSESAPAIPYGVDTNRFQPREPGERQARRAALGLADTTFVVAMVAFVYAPKRAVHRRQGIKGHDLLLDAWTVFHDRHPDSHLLLVGGGMDAAGERYRLEIMSRHGLPSTDRGITWAQTTGDVRDFYAVADLSVSPSLSENHGAALEAGAMGLPSIVSDAGALPETVSEDTGWVVPRGDVPALVAALERAWAEYVAGNLRARGRRARELIVRKFDVQATSAAVADVIESAARRNGSPPPPEGSQMSRPARLRRPYGWWRRVVRRAAQYVRS